MTEYEPFLVYELDDSGEKNQKSITEEELQSNLYPEQVLVIVREDLRRIFIWKGPKSPVRKRFISSRVAQELQEELRADSRYHRCKIVSVDAGDEPTEFLDAFQLESMEVTERLADMRYVRNIERDRGIMSKSTIISRDQKDSKKEYFSPALQDTSSKVVMSSIPSYISKPRTKATKQSAGLSKDQQEKIKDKILKKKIPENYKRLNLVLGHTLYGVVSKTAKVFGEDVEETEWEPIKKVPKNMIELENHVLRVHFDEKNALVEAIEVLEKQKEPKSKPVPKPPVRKTAPKKKPALRKTAPKKKPAPRKTAPKKKPVMTPMPTKPAAMKSKAQKTETKDKQNEEKETKPNTTGRRQVPKIPKED